MLVDYRFRDEPAPMPFFSPQEERYKKHAWPFNTPDAFLLSDADIERFVKLLLPPALLGMYSKVSLRLSPSGCDLRCG
jgi:hypothetical protein